LEKIIRWFVENSVAANLAMAIIIVAGLFTLPNTNLEVFPAIEPEIINVTVVYPGASPEDVEEGICVPVEEQLQGLEGVKKISSNASENIGTITVELMPGEDVNQMRSEIKAQVDTIDNFPDDAERPTVSQFVAVSEVITVAVSGEMSEASLVNLTDDIRDEINALPGITLTTIKGKKAREISIEISEATLEKYGLSFDQISAAIRASSLDIPGGSVDTELGEILIRTKGQAYSETEFEMVPIMALPDGSMLLLKDVASINDTFADVDLAQRFNNEKSLLISVYRVGDQNAVDISATVRDYIGMKADELPEGAHITPWNDEARILRGRIDLLVKNGYLGFTLVVIVLAIFLKPKLAFWVSLGIPISFMGGFWLLPSADVSINMLSLFVFILVLGIVVDDAIIVGENIFIWKERGLSNIDAAVKGATQVSTPVIFAILTTMVTFSPMLFVQGDIGKIWTIIPKVTIIVLFWSLFESLTILPVHLAHIGEKESRFASIRKISGRWGKFQSKVKNWLILVVERFYKPFLRRAITKRGMTAAIAASAFVITIGFLGGGWMKFTFFPPLEADIVTGLLEYPEGTPTSVTERGLLQLEQSANILRAELLRDYPDEQIFQNMLATIGDQPLRTRSSRGPGSLDATFSGAHLAELVIELSPGEERPISATEISNRWRQLTGPIQGAKELSFASNLFSAGDPVNIQLTSKNLAALQTVTVKLKERLSQYDGVFDIKDTFVAGKKEVKLTLLDEATNYGINNINLARQVRQAFFGEEAQTFQRGRDQVKVMVRFPKNERRSMGNLEQMNIRTAGGQEIPLKQLASMDLARSYASIQRVNRKRAVNITSDIDLSVTSGNEVIAALITKDLPRVLKDYPSVTYTLEGEQREQNQNLASIGKNFLIALFIVYALLAIPFRSYFQPLVVMSAIPFGLIGAVIGHFIMGMNMSILSIIGIVALAGVVVNDSLVMVDFINRYRKDGYTAFEAAMQAGPRRFRPILLTSITTFVGLVPLLLEKSVQAKFLIPMGVSLAFGVLFATVITLILVPTSYMILEDFLKWKERYRY
tara:strand:- start:29247 stop:32408 length:3162 start_codon:yes stop_codon:yes gene_type:complete